VKLVLNEMWSAEIARQLRGRGFDVVAAAEAPRRYRGISDDEFFRRAQEDGRTVVTDNVRDFMPIVADRAGRGEPHCGVVFALRPTFDRARPGVVGAMTTAFDAFLRGVEAAPSAVVFLRG
jgi:Domain of unknown function (DUF5615)